MRPSDGTVRRSGVGVDPTARLVTPPPIATLAKPRPPPVSAFSVSQVAFPPNVGETGQHPRPRGARRGPGGATLRGARAHAGLPAPPDLGERQEPTTKQRTSSPQSSAFSETISGLPSKRCNARRRSLRARPGGRQGGSSLPPRLHGDAGRWLGAETQGTRFCGHEGPWSRLTLMASARQEVFKLLRPSPRKPRWKTFSIISTFSNASSGAGTMSRQGGRCRRMRPSGEWPGGSKSSLGRNRLARSRALRRLHR
jgi:hypothetical protein